MIKTVIIIFVIILIVVGLWSLMNGLPNGVGEKMKYDIVSKVIKVVDGDTIDLLSGERVRLAIANTPERGQDGFKQATQFTKNLCLGKDAKIDLDSGQKGGSFGRVIGVVYCNGENLNERLIEDGYAVVWTKFCKKSEFKEMLCK